jgi:predicted TPR repeat methyltransferase
MGTRLSRDRILPAEYQWCQHMVGDEPVTLEDLIGHGLALVKSGDLEGALRTFHKAEEEFPQNHETPGLIGRVLFTLGRDSDGIEALVEAVKRNPTPDNLFELVQMLSHFRAHLNVEQACIYHHDRIKDDTRFLPYRGLAQIVLERWEDAVETNRRALAAKPDDKVIVHNLSIALLRSGRLEESVECFSSCLADWNGQSDETASRDFLDKIAVGYDRNELHNFFSDRLLRLYLENFPGRRLKRVLELGTGTGLLASKLPASATSITGVELSSSMLEQARARGVYDQLVEGCMPQVLESLGGQFETILSSCVLYYFADLRPFFDHAARLLEPGGAFLFSVDPLSDPREIAVTGPGEYAHSRAYLRRIAAETGFKEVTIETDRHRATPGFWCAFTRA